MFFKSTEQVRQQMTKVLVVILFEVLVVGEQRKYLYAPHSCCRQRRSGFRAWLSSQDGPAAQEKAVRRVLNPATLGALEHVHETSQWYSTLLQRGSTEADHCSSMSHAACVFSSHPVKCIWFSHSCCQAPQQTLKCAAFILHAEETWLHEPSSTEGFTSRCHGLSQLAGAFALTVMCIGEHSGVAQKMVRAVQSATFQTDKQVRC
eukprot:6454744-Amphidinium_carterae.1